MDTGDVVALIVGLLSAGVAVWAVVVAHRANRRADEANAIAERSNGIAVDANKIAGEALEVQRQTLPPEWSAAEEVSQYLYQFRNQSGQTIVVQAVEARPERFQGLVHLTATLPNEVEHGDVFKVHSMRTFGGGANALRITWRYLGESDDRVTDRSL